MRTRLETKNKLLHTEVLLQHLEARSIIPTNKCLAPFDAHLHTHIYTSSDRKTVHRPRTRLRGLSAKTYTYAGLVCLALSAAFALIYTVARA